jgi:hypothetical protein
MEPPYVVVVVGFASFDRCTLLRGLRESGIRHESGLVIGCFGEVFFVSSASFPS